MNDVGLLHLPALEAPCPVTHTMTVESVLIINNFGKPRLAKFYRRPLLSTAHQQHLIRTIFKLISTRDDDVNDDGLGNCNFLDAPELTPLLQRQELKVIYRHYATLWFVFVVDQSESELGILDLIQVSVDVYKTMERSGLLLTLLFCAYPRSSWNHSIDSSQTYANWTSFFTTRR